MRISDWSSDVCSSDLLPNGVWNTVNGDKEIVDAILRHPKIAAISFVGSTHVGEYIYRQGCANDKRVAAYTGGKNHMVVMHDADLESAAAAFVSAAYGSSSQRCMAVRSEEHTSELQ